MAEYLDGSDILASYRIYVQINKALSLIGHVADNGKDLHGAGKYVPKQGNTQILASNRAFGIRGGARLGRSTARH